MRSQPPNRGNFLPDRLGNTQQFAHTHQQALADLRDLDAGRPARQQRHAPLGLQLLECVRHRRLTDAQPLPGRRKATELRNDGEDFELRESHVRISLFMSFCSFHYDSE